MEARLISIMKCLHQSMLLIKMNEEYDELLVKIKLF